MKGNNQMHVQKNMLIAIIAIAVVLGFVIGAASPVEISINDTFAAKGGAGGGGKGGGGKPGTGGTGTLSLVMVTDRNANGQPNFNDVVTFNVSTTATDKPWVTLKCYQNGTLVAQVSNGIFPTSLWINFTLGPSLNWQSGAAECTATLEIYGGSTLGTLSFHVDP